LTRRKPIKKRGSVFGPHGLPDRVTMVIVGVLLFIGLVLVYDSSVIVASAAPYNDPFHFFKLQIVWIIIGLIGGYVAFKIDYHIFPKIVSPALIGTIVLLIVVLIAGTLTYGAKRWIDFGPFAVQPSELAKLTFTLYLASWLSKQKNIVNKFDSALKNYFVHDLLPFLLVLFVVTSLILVGRDLATTAIVGLIALSIYFISGKDLMHSLGSGLIVLTMGIVGLLAAIMEPYRLNRIRTYLHFLQTGEVDDPGGKGFQLYQILVAVGSGGIFGVGFGESRQKFHYLGQAAFTDTIFAVFAEEFGLFGSIILIALFVALMFRGFKIASTAQDRLGTLIATGITFWISLQAFLNIAANVGLIPLTGIPLPFISYGGSSMVVMLTGIGILLNVSKYSKLK
jgi:cell division protein FtsW